MQLYMRVMLYEWLVHRLLYGLQKFSNFHKRYNALKCELLDDRLAVYGERNVKPHRRRGQALTNGTGFSLCEFVWPLYRCE